MNPEEIRRDFNKDFPYREICVNMVFESQESTKGEPFLVIVDRRVGLIFWTAFVPTPAYLEKVKRGKLIWQPKSK